MNMEYQNAQRYKTLRLMATDEKFLDLVETTMADIEGVPSIELFDGAVDKATELRIKYEAGEL